MDFSQIFEFFKTESARHARITSGAEWSNFKKSSVNAQWLYLILWRKQPTEVYSFGTSSNTSDRIRKSSVINPKLTGKYDRRVDYLMMKIAFGDPEIHVFEVSGQATDSETAAKNRLGQRHCYVGLDGADRFEISRSLVSQFKATPHWASLNDSDQSHFDEYLDEVFFAQRRHPRNPARTFYWGDSLEPGFLPVIGMQHLEPIIERVLRVRFYD